jgi:hypothetical protein
MEALRFTVISARLPTPMIDVLRNQFGQTLDDLTQFDRVHFPCPFADPVN